MFLFCLMAMFAVAGCQSRDTLEYDEYDEYLASFGCNGGNACVGANRARFIDADTEREKQSEIRFSRPNGNDLVLETSGYILQVEGAPNKKYDYYVWTGDKDYSDDPDLIIQNGTAAVLVE